MPRSHLNPDLRSSRYEADIQEASLYYRFMRMLTRISLVSLWRIRAFERHHEPSDGGVLYICNHQSFLDPMLMGMALSRPMNYMARDTLFKQPVFKKLIESLNAFPVRRGTADTRALKEATRRLRKGRQVVLFAEGTRTPDGRIQPFLPGVAFLAQRAAKWSVPVLIEGAYEAWPRNNKLPRPGGHIIVQYGKPIPQETARKMGAQDFVDSVRKEIIDIQTEVRTRLGKEPFDYSRR
ncbi:MAG: lysophospholipid acyltransferase family protein [Phycisphaerae bacterium]